MPYVIIGLAVIIAGISYFFRTPVGKGIWGEFQVKLVLGKNKENEKYVINNLMIVNENKSSQIDHIIINRTGVFVIETKNYSGYIYGNENQHEWTQVLQYGKIKNKFYNPILQNKTHIYALSKLLGRDDCFISIIVFINATLKTESTTLVGYIGNIRKRYKEQTKEIFSLEEMNSIYATLLEYKNNPPVTNKEHVQEIKQMKSNIQNNICPRCGKPLLLRQGKHGEFYACSGYPKCRFIKSN